MSRPLLLALVFGLFSATVATAQTPEAANGQFKDWRIVSTPDGLCYIGTVPKESTGKESAGKEGQPSYLLVTHRRKDVHEVSTSLGANFAPEKEVTLSVGKQNFALFSQEQVAWARDEATDAKIVEALKKAGSASVKGTLANGKATTQKFSLSGFGAAFKRMGTLCK